MAMDEYETMSFMLMNESPMALFVLVHVEGGGQSIFLEA